MNKLVIRDLEYSAELDRENLADIKGGYVFRRFPLLKLRLPINLAFKKKCQPIYTGGQIIYKCK